MSEKLALINELRAKGATIRMIDDVALYLEDNGGYNSPVFVATLEFILKIRQMLQSVLEKQEQSVPIKSEFGEKDYKETENVNFGAAKTAVSNDDEIENYEREKIINHINLIEAQRDSYLVSNNYKDNQNLQLEVRGGKNKKSVSGNRGGGLLERLFKIKSAFNASKKNQQRNQIVQTEAWHEMGARNTAIRQIQQVNQASQGNSLTKMNLIKMKLLSSLRMSKDKTLIGQEALKAKKESKLLNSQIKTEAKDGKKSLREEPTNLKATTTKAETGEVSKEKKAVNEISLSKLIDQVVKISQQQKISTTEHKPPAEKGKFEKQHADKKGTRTDEQKVSDMKVQEAIKNLQNSGVKTSTTDTKTKKEADAQIVGVQASNGGGSTPKLER